MFECLCDVRIKFLASNSMLENAVDVFVQTKDIVFSCSFLLKCLRLCVKEMEWTIFYFYFGEIRNSGPACCAYTHTIMISYDCKRHTPNSRGCSQGNGEK